MTKAKYRNQLPQLGSKQFLTDGGLETTLVFHDGFDLPLFAAFPLVETEKGQTALDRYIRKFCEIAVRDGKGMILDTPTWRASSRWANELGYSREKLHNVHRKAIHALMGLRKVYETPASPFVVNGVIGPQDDGYNPKNFMTIDQARKYHHDQVEWFAELGADMVSAITMTYVEEAIGVALAAKRASMPSVISFTVETDGLLPSGQPLSAAIEEVDAATQRAPAYFMINCAHPDHFIDVLKKAGEWKLRIGGVRANASRLSHAELDTAEHLDEGSPTELAVQYNQIKALLPNLTVMGGCCGTHHKHVDAISSASVYSAAA